MASEKCSSKGQAWFCTTGLPSDIEIEVDNMTFHLHKFPLMSKSKTLHRLIITEQESKPLSTLKSDNKGKEIEEEEEEYSYPHITLHDFPGSSDTFEIVAKYCYGVKFDLTASTVIPLRCAAEHLEMTEEYSLDNLISKTEKFLTQTVYKSLSKSIKALKACEQVITLSKSLGITEKCIETIVSKATSTNSSSFFGWPVNDGQGEEISLSATNAFLWVEDLTQLSLPIFKNVIESMRTVDLRSDVIESCLISYAKKHIPGMLRSNRKPSPPSSSENEQRELLETITLNLPLDKSYVYANTHLLFGLLRTAIILNVSETCRDRLERKIGCQLEQATLDDLLVPSYSYLNETLYDVDLVERIMSHFLDTFERLDTAIVEVDDGDGRSRPMMLVGKLIDGFLAEIASDVNLKLEKFYNLAISLPDQARLYDDGLYRAVDVYLKAHPLVTEVEREKISSVMDCQKLTLEACTHAAQNERLPLRSVVQVLFFEQLQLRQAIAGTLVAAQLPSPASEVDGEEAREGVKWKNTVRENQVLRLDMDTMRTRVHRLEKECSNMKNVIAKIDKDGSPANSRPKSWSITKKFGCKFKTQVCDSQEATMVDRRSRRS